MSKLKIIIKKNASYEKGEYGYSIHEQGVAGMTANIVPTDEAGLKKALKDYGCTDEYASDVISRLQEKLESVTVVVEKS